MPHEEPDSSVCQPVEHGREEPSKDRSGPPLSSTMKAPADDAGAFSMSGPALRGARSPDTN